MTKAPSRSTEDHHGTSTDALEEAKRIMKRLTEMPHKPREPIGKRRPVARKKGGENLT
jgi:hypothetical protein